MHSAINGSDEPEASICLLKSNERDDSAEQEQKTEDEPTTKPKELKNIQMNWRETFLESVFSHREAVEISRLISDFWAAD